MVVGNQLRERVEPSKIAIIGAGQRGCIYARHILKHPDKATVVTVADPRPHRRGKVQEDFNLSPEHVHEDWRQLLAAPKIADAVIIAVLDGMHRELVHDFAAQGYHILCEKPMATSLEDCLAMYEDVTRAGIIFGIGHVMRYSPYNVAVKQVIDSGVLGDIINVQHIEPVGYFHFVHSYVRGNWGREADSSFSLMTKCCHDIDILNFYMGDNKNPAVKISSFGSLNHFRPEKKPKEAQGVSNCLDCSYERQCPYSAKKAYLDPITGDISLQKENRAKHFVESKVLDIENVTAALRTTGYGRCVYDGYNDVCDHQVVNIEYKDGATASLTMSAFTESECDRKTVIHGSRGELIGDMVTFTTFDFAKRIKTHHQPPKPVGGHGGGDGGITDAFMSALLERRQAPLKIKPSEVLTSHLLVFAAEQSRLEERTVNFGRFYKDAVGRDL